MSDSALSQLTEMGVPRGRARAALAKAKGDAMSAAERVFAGEFDEIPSDDEVDLGPDGESEQAMQEDGEEDDGEFGNILEDEDEGKERLFSDPYAGIFFSKDRVEQIVEPTEKPQMVTVKSTGGDGRQKTEKVRLMGRGEWMSGCPEGNEQSHLFQLHTMFSDPCPCPSPGCSKVFDRAQNHFFAIMPTFVSYLRHVQQQMRAKCPRCKQTICLACEERVSDAPSRSSGSAKRNPLEMEELLHCLPVQGLLIGMGLYLIESALKEREVLKLAPKNPATVKKARAKVGDGTSTTPSLAMKLAMWPGDDDDYDDMSMFGVGGVGGSAKGTGYAGSGAEDRSWQLEAQKAEEAADVKTVKLLSEVQIYLPFLNRASGTRASDHLVHPTALAHLRRRSAFVNDLLRNDSLLDMSNRGDLYRALFDWLELVSSHEALASMMAMPQMRPTSSKPSETDKDSLLVTYESAASPRELLESCVIQAQAALKGLKATESAAEKEEELDDGLGTDELMFTAAEVAKRAKDKEAVKDASLDRTSYRQLLEFCQRIISCAERIDRSLADVKGQDFVDRMRKTLPRLSDSSEPTQQPSATTADDAGIVKIYEEWVTRTRFEYCDMSNEVSSSSRGYRHAMSASIVSMAGHTAPKRSLAIAKELAVLTRNLPVAWHSSIFLRVDETRVDCIKAMIVGPEGTPYETGLFIFDIFLPMDYNFKCPQVKSITTNGGKFRYNPNLYADGKVCLSLLGTWSGPGWISGQSTLLQVLISIQSLILCEEPYTNEPGWATAGGSKESKAYSANIRRMVLIDAMANNMKQLPFPFADVVKTHFRLKAKSIRKQLEKWSAIDDGLNVATDSYVVPTPGDTPEDDQPKGQKKTKRVKKGTPFEVAADEVRRLLDELEKPKASG